MATIALVQILPIHDPKYCKTFQAMCLILAQWSLSELMQVKVLPQSLAHKCSVNGSDGPVLLKVTHDTYGPCDWRQSHMQLALEGTYQIDRVLYPNFVGIHYITSCL